jgi:glycosyltransferase involved in cell wall biosynthesis
MRILQMHNHHASKGGAMEVLAHERNLLIGSGHDVDQVTVVAAEQSGLSSARLGAKAVWNREVAKELDDKISQFSPDVIHVHTPFPVMSPAVFRTAARRGVPALTTLHSFRYSCVAGTCWRDGHVCEDCVGKTLKLPGIRHRCYHNSIGGSAALTAGLILHTTLGTFHRDVARYLTLTEFSRRLLVRDGYPADRIVVKPNSVPDPGVGSTPAGEPYIVFAGRLIEIKGIRTMLHAWEQVRGGLRLRIAGDGELRHLVEQHAASDDSIDFLGWRSEEEVQDLMAGAVAVLLPSEWYEGLPLVILRSLAVGTPVIVSDLENFAADVVGDGTGWSFPVQNSDALASILQHVADDPTRAYGLRDAARNSYEARYSPTVDLARLEAVYEAVLAERQG